MVRTYCTLEDTLNFPFPFLIYLFGSALHFTFCLLLGRGETFISQAAREQAASHVVRLVLHDINRKNSLETI